MHPIPMYQYYVRYAGSGRELEAKQTFPLVAIHGGYCALTGVSVSGNLCGHGLGVAGGAAVTLLHCAFEHNDLVGMHVADDSSLSASHCRFAHNAQVRPQFPCWLINQ